MRHQTWLLAPLFFMLMAQQPLMAQQTLSPKLLAQPTLSPNQLYISPALSVRSTLKNEYPVSISGEYLLNQWAGVGGYFGFGLGTNTVFLGARANVHPQTFLKSIATPPKLDYYLGFSAGISVGSTTKAQLSLLPCVGVRYFATNRLAPFVEIGNNPLGYLSVGLSFLAN